MAKSITKSQKRKADSAKKESGEDEWNSDEQVYSEIESDEEKEESQDEAEGELEQQDSDSEEEPEEISTVKSKENALYLQNKEKLKKLESQKQLKQKRRERDLKNSLQQQQKRARLLPQEIIEAAQEEEEEIAAEQPKIKNSHVRLEQKLNSAQHGNITVTVAKNRISNPIDPNLLEFRNNHLYRESVKRAPGNSLLI
ncbi:hypothetical protein HDV01_001002 [Terramyces sp. JEL0728]|nr:hypothetical protein HDV01_001002 [Terramyces sp. JEL0728]